VRVRFVLPDRQAEEAGEPFVEYDFGHAREPAKGESVVADGTDNLFPAGVYEVTHTTLHVGLRGPQMMVCDLRWVYWLPNEALGSPASHKEAMDRLRALTDEPDREAMAHLVMETLGQAEYGGDRIDGDEARNVVDALYPPTS
jgi:hypothetical protein